MKPHLSFSVTSTLFIPTWNFDEMSVGGSGVMPPEQLRLKSLLSPVRMTGPSP